MIRLSTTSINKKIISNNIKSNTYSTPSIKQFNPLNAYESLLNPFSDINTHNKQQSISSNNSIVDEQSTPKQNINKHLTTQNIIKHTPKQNTVNYTNINNCNTSNGNQNTTIYNSNGKLFNHNIHTSIQSKIQTPKIRLKNSSIITPNSYTSKTISHSNKNNSKTYTHSNQSTSSYTHSHLNHYTPNCKQTITNSHSNQSTSSTILSHPKHYTPNGKQISSHSHSNQSISSNSISHSNHYTPIGKQKITQLLPGTPTHNLFTLSHALSKLNPSITHLHSTSLPGTPKHKIYSKAHEHAQHNPSIPHSHSTSLPGTPKHKLYSLVSAHSKHKPSIKHSHSTSLPGTPTRLLETFNTKIHHYSHSANTTPISKLQLNKNNEICHAHSHTNNNIIPIQPFIPINPSIPNTPVFGSPQLSINNNESLHDVIERNKQIEQNLLHLDNYTASQLTPLTINNDSPLSVKSHYDEINYIDNQPHLVNGMNTNGMDCNESEHSIINEIDNSNLESLNNSIHQDSELSTPSPPPPNTNSNSNDPPRTQFRSILRRNRVYRDHISSGRITRWYCPIDGSFTNVICSYGKSFTGDFKGWKNVGSLHNHIKLHCQHDKSIIPDEFYINHNRSWCNGCGKLYATSQKHKHDGCQQLADTIEDEAPEHEVAALLPIEDRPLPSIDDIFKYSCNQVKAIPGKLFRQWNDLLLNLGGKILEFNDNYHWKLLCMVSKVIWHTPMRGGKNSSKRQLNKFIRRIGLFNKGEYVLLWDEFKKEFDIQNVLNIQNEEKNHLDPSRTDYYEKLEQRRAKAAIYYARNGDLSGGMRALTSFGVLPLTDKNKQLLADLHPHEEPLSIDQLSDYKDIHPLHLSPDITLASIKEYKITTSAGADGFRPYYLNTFIGDYKQDVLIGMWNNIENLLLSGKACDDLHHWFGDCSGTLLAKNLEHTKGRPIGAGLCVRRTATRGIVESILDDVNSEVFPFQIGAAKNGPELLVHTLRTVVSKYEDDWSKAFLSVDEKNAFNEIYRTYTREVVQLYTPKILPFWDLIYSQWSKIYYSHEFDLYSKRGYQQGDGLASFGFGLALYHKFKNHPELLKILLNIWYHDDGGLFCDISKMDKIASLIEELSLEIGLTLNAIKTKIYSISNTITSFNCTKVDERNFEIVGSFIGDEDSTKHWLDDRLNEYKILLNSIKTIDDPQIQLSYLYYCCNYSKIMYLMRTIPPEYLNEFCIGYDKLVRDLFENIIQSPICNYTYQQISLNFKNGGIGLRASQKHHLAAYLSSFSQCESRIIDILVNKHDYKLYDDLDISSWTMDEYNLVTQDIHILGDTLCDELNVSRSLLSEQKSLSAYIDDIDGEKLFDQLDINGRARLNSCSAPGAASWISSIPTYKYKIPKSEFLVILRMWLGIKIFECNEQFINCFACHKKVADPYGYHYISCKVTKGILYGLTKRHNIARNLLCDWMTLAHYDPEKEKHGLCVNVGKHCPADVYVPIYQDGMPVAIDIGITSPMQPKFITKASKEVLATGNAYHDAKLNKYRNLIDRELLIYKPFIVESFGGMTEESESILKKLCYDLKDRLRMNFSHLYNLKRREMIVKIWRANAKMVLDRLPNNI